MDHAVEVLGLGVRLTDEVRGVGLEPLALQVGQVAVLDHLASGALLQLAAALEQDPRQVLVLSEGAREKLLGGGRADPRGLVARDVDDRGQRVAHLCGHRASAQDHLHGVLLTRLGVEAAARDPHDLGQRDAGLPQSIPAGHVSFLGWG